MRYGGTLYCTSIWFPERLIHPSILAIAAKNMTWDIRTANKKGDRIVHFAFMCCENRGLVASMFIVGPSFYKRNSSNLLESISHNRREVCKDVYMRSFLLL